MNNWLNIAHEWLLPRHCLLCLGAASGIDLCDECQRALPRLENPCPGCGTPLASGNRCARCLKSPPPFERVHIPYLYAEPVTALIHALKFRRRLAAGSVLGKLLAQYIASRGLRPPQCIVPVPLHPQRQRDRGFNQSMEIARPLAARLDVPIAPRLALRTRSTVPQSSLRGAGPRRRNMRAAFSVQNRATPPVRHVAIVDDVVTTGATVISLALALKSAGVTSVELWCIARAGEP